jgi:hypothetical protein
MTSSPLNVSMLTDDTKREDRGGGFSSLSLEDAIWVYCSPCVFIFGMTGNALTVCVMSRRRYRGSSVRVYMLLLAVFDSAVLLCAVPPEWLEALGYVTVTHWHPVVCKLERFLYYVTGDMSIWTLCAFTVDRFVAVCFPLLRRRPGSTLGRLTTAACPLIVTLAAAKNAHVAWTRGIEYDPATGAVIDLCGKIAEYVYFETYVRPWIVFVTVSVIPFLILLLCNLAIVRALVLSERIRRGSRRKVKTNNSNSTSGDGGKIKMTSRGGAGSNHGGSTDGGFVQTSVMCLSVSFAFLVCMVPSIILYIGRPYWTSRQRPNPTYDMAKVINRVLVCVNHSVNFWLYCLTGHNFRRELKAMLTCRSRRELDAKSFLAYGEASALHFAQGQGQSYCSFFANGAAAGVRSSTLRLATLAINSSRSPTHFTRSSPRLYRPVSASSGTGVGVGTNTGTGTTGDHSPWPQGSSRRPTLAQSSPSPSELTVRTTRSSDDESRQALLGNCQQQRLYYHHHYYAVDCSNNKRPVRRCISNADTQQQHQPSALDSPTDITMSIQCIPYVDEKDFNSP